MKKWISLLVLFALLCVPMVSGCGLGTYEEESRLPVEDDRMLCDVCKTELTSQKRYQIDAENYIPCPKSDGKKDSYVTYNVYYDCKLCWKTIETSISGTQMYCHDLGVYYDGEHP